MEVAIVWVKFTIDPTPCIRGIPTVYLEDVSLGYENRTTVQGEKIWGKERGRLPALFP